jgi:hypothetical protein
MKTHRLKRHAPAYRSWMWRRNVGTLGAAVPDVGEQQKVPVENPAWLYGF